MMKSDSLGISEMKEVVNLISQANGRDNSDWSHYTCPYNSRSQGQGSSSPGGCQFSPENKAFIFQLR